MQVSPPSSQAGGRATVQGISLHTKKKPTKQTTTTKQTYMTLFCLVDSLAYWLCTMLIVYIYL